MVGRVLGGGSSLSTASSFHAIQVRLGGDFRFKVAGHVGVCSR
jgi:hypothetical protein